MNIKIRLLKFLLKSLGRVHIGFVDNIGQSTYMFFWKAGDRKIELYINGEKI